MSLPVRAEMGYFRSSVEKGGTQLGCCVQMLHNFGRCWQQRSVTSLNFHLPNFYLFLLLAFRCVCVC